MNSVNSISKSRLDVNFGIVCGKDSGESRAFHGAAKLTGLRDQLLNSSAAILTASLNTSILESVGNYPLAPGGAQAARNESGGRYFKLLQIPEVFFVADANLI